MLGVKVCVNVAREVLCHALHDVISKKARRDVPPAAEGSSTKARARAFACARDKYSRHGRHDSGHVKSSTLQRAADDEKHELHGLDSLLARGRGHAVSRLADCKQ